MAVVIGANDVVNPDARDNPNSPIAGMPILEVDKARFVIVLKRGKGKGFSGLENPLFFGSLRVAVLTTTYGGGAGRAEA